jgi:1-acyl-sn-glycerol-3-phosphate acyltransferase
MWRAIAALIRLVLIMLCTFACEAARLTFYPLAAHNEPRDRRWRRWWFQLWARLVCRIAGIRVVSHGPKPEPPCMVVANHLGYFDILVLTQQTGFVFVAMSDIAGWALLGPIAKTLYVVFVDRKDKSKAGDALPDIRRTFEQGDGLVIFPEGGVTRGLDVDPFRSPLVEPALELGLPVVCASIHYETAPGAPPASGIIGWWRPEPIQEHFFRALKYPGTTATIHFSTIDPAGMDRKQLALALHTEVKRSFQPHP